MSCIVVCLGWIGIHPAVSCHVNDGLSLPSFASFALHISHMTSRALITHGNTVRHYFLPVQRRQSLHFNTGSGIVFSTQQRIHPRVRDRAERHRVAYDKGNEFIQSAIRPAADTPGSNHPRDFFFEGRWRGERPGKSMCRVN